MATEGNGGLGSSEEAREGQLMDPALERVAAFLMEDSTHNTLPWLESYIRRLVRYMILLEVREAFEHFVKSGPASVADGRMEDVMQSLLPLLEPQIHRIVREAFEHFVKSGPAREQIQELDRRNLQLRFQSSLPDSFFTGKKVEGRGGALIRVKLIDTSTGHVVASGPLSSLKLAVVPLEGDFENKDDDWTQEIFESHVAKQRTGKPPLLTGDLEVSLKEGEGSLGELKFTDNSISMRSGKFRLGVKVASSLCEGIRVREGITDAFKVKDRRGESYKKHDLPTLDDYVWRLKNIGKNGAFHKRLDSNGISKVKDFLWLLGIDAQRLREILGSSMKVKTWDTLEEHAKTCVLSGKYHVYYADNTKNSGVVFKNMSELCGLIEGGKYYSAETLSDSQKVFADTLKKVAGDNWKDIVEYDGLLPLETNPSKRASSSQTDVVALESCPSDVDQRVSPAFLTHVAPQPGLVNPGLAVGVPVFLPRKKKKEAPLPCQPPSVPSGEAYENSMLDFEGGKYYSAETYSSSQKVLVDTSKRNASDDWKHIVDYDGRMLDMNQSAASSEQFFVNPGPAAGDDFFNDKVAGGWHGFLGSKDVRMECRSPSSVLYENYEYGDMVSVHSDSEFPDFNEEMF